MRGRAWVFGNDVNTDNIFPTRFASILDTKEMAHHVFADIRPDFAIKFSPGDVVVGGDNFGCGSLRETAILGFKALGSDVIIAKSFARGFIRNAVNKGVWLIKLGNIDFAVSEGDMLEVDCRSGDIKNIRTGVAVHGEPFTGIASDILNMGGITAYVKKKRVLTKI
jgi:3-isopropylmalate/(R)-2-methylmalate dehydratase small subunit